VRSELVRVPRYTGEPARQQPRVLPRGQATVRRPSAGEQTVARFLTGRPQIIIQGLPGRLSEFEFHRPSSLLLADARSIGRVAARRDVIYFQGDDVATTKFAIDSDVEQRQIANPTLDLELRPDGPDMLRAEWRLRANDLSLIPRYALGDVLVGAGDIGRGDLLS
jgi:hypothetical protein